MVVDPNEVKRICALIACMPEALSREPYILALAEKTQFHEGVLRREIDRIAERGAVAVALAYERGEAASSAPKKPEEVPDGWWNRERGEGEDLWDFFYRRFCRMKIAGYLTDWHRFDEWAQRVDQLQVEDDSSIFQAEWDAWVEEKARREMDSKAGELAKLRGGVALPFDPEAAERQSVDQWEELLARISLLVPDEKLGPIIDRCEEVAQGHKYVKGQEWMVDAVQERLDQIWDERARGITAALQPEEGV